jgi:hypothetical protein
MAVEGTIGNMLDGFEVFMMGDCEEYGLDCSAM